MIECLIWLIVWVIAAIIVLWALESAINAVAPIPPQVWMLVRILVGLVLILAALRCFFGDGPLPWRMRP